MQKPTVIYLNINSQFEVLNCFLANYLSQFKKLQFEVIKANYADMNGVDFSKIAIKQSFFFYIGGLADEINWVTFMHQNYPNLPLVNMLVDHPFYCLHQKNMAVNYFPIIMHPEWQTILDPLLPGRSSGFILHAGYKTNNNTEISKASTRKNEIMFLGSISDPEAIRQEWQTNAPQISAVIEEIIAILLNNQTYLPLDQFLMKHVKTTSATMTALYTYIDRYLRNYWRLTTLKIIGNAKIPIIVLVKQPMKLMKMLECTKNMRIQSAINFDKTLDLMQQSKIVLTSAYQNGLPLFSERIPSAMMNGAVSVHSGSPFISTLVTDNLQGVAFNHYEQASLPDTLTELLADHQRLDFIAENGRQHALEHFSNAVHAKKLVALVDDFRNNKVSVKA